jgi:hypothetical protein
VRQSAEENLVIPEKLEKIIIDTDTVYDDDGLPVSIRKGAKGFFLRIEEKFAIVLVNYQIGTKTDTERLAVPIEHIRRITNENQSETCPSIH